jgi:PAS domain S-box-containing protein
MLHYRNYIALVPVFAGGIAFSVFISGYFDSSEMALTIGILISVLLTVLLGIGAYRESLAKRIIEERSFELKERQHQYQLIFNSTGEAIVTFERDGTITSLNDMTETLFGYQRDELIGENMSRLMLEQEWDTQKKHIAYIDTDIPTSFSKRRELTALHKDRSRFFMDIAVNRFEFHDESTFVAVMRDITERKATLRKLQENQIELQSSVNDLEASRQTAEDQAAEIVTIAEEQSFLRAKAVAADNSKSDFLATVSHEIRTPLTSILGVSDLVLDTLNDPQQRENVLIIQRAGQGLLRIINDILDHAKLEAGKMEIDAVDFHLEATVKNTMEVMLHRADERDTFLDYEISGDLPSGINADPQRIHQILVNLIGNAIKFTANGRVSLKIAPYDEMAGKPGLKFTVCDTGIGISEEAQERLFGKFEQEDASTFRTHGGSGLGLSICKMLVELMGGEIGVVSKLHEGSSFWFTLPYSEATSDVTPDDLSDRKLVYVAERPLNILLAEDNRVNRMLISNILVNVGHHVETAEDGEVAVQAVADNDYDLVLMDVRMPKLGGPEATEIIRETEGEASRLPIIAVTADATTSHRDRFLESGMDAVVSKPVELDFLLRTIDDVMDERIHSSKYEIIDTIEPEMEAVTPPLAEPDQPDENNEAISDLMKRMSEFS